MTAINIIVSGDVAHVLSDGAFCSSDGIVRQIAPKVSLLPHIPAVVGILGNSVMLQGVTSEIQITCPNFEAIVQKLEPTARVMHDRTAGYVSSAGLATHFEIMVVGWSEVRQSFEIYTLHNRENEEGAWVVRQSDDPGGRITPAPPIELLNAQGWDLQDFSQFDPEVHGILLLSAQRTMKNVQTTDGVPRRFVGGFAQLTTLERDRITSRILKRWNDTVGAEIIPSSLSGIWN